MNPYRALDTDLALLAKRANSWYRTKKQRDRYARLHRELSTSRKRLKLISTELNEWRWKVGGASYNLSGSQAKGMVREGLLSIIGRHEVQLLDEDLRG